MDKKFLFLSLIFFLLAVSFTALLTFKENLLPLTRAQQFYKASPKKSLVIVFPTKVKADGKSAASITIFAKNEDGIPVKNKKVIIKTNLGKITPSSAETDENGKASFIITSDEQGVAKIQPIVDNTLIINSVSIKFE